MKVHIDAHVKVDSLAMVKHVLTQMNVLMVHTLVMNLQIVSIGTVISPVNVLLDIKVMAPIVMIWTNVSPIITIVLVKLVAV